MTPTKRYLPLIIAGPLSAPFMLLSRQLHAPDFVTGLIGGVGIGLSLMAVVLIARKRAC